MYYEFPVCVQLEFLYATSFKTGKNKYTAYATYTIYTAYSLYHIRTSSDFIPEKILPSLLKDENTFAD